MKKIVSVAVMIAGAALFAFGTHMIEQADQGEEKISQAEQEVEGHRGLLLGRRRYEKAEGQIGQAEQAVSQAELKAAWIQRSGIALFVIGLGALAYYSIRKKI